MDVRDVAIIGAGPAGISTAIQLRRMGLNPVLLEKDEPGGAVLNAYRIDNYPGFPDGIKGIDLAKLMKKQLERFRVELHHEEAVSIEYEDFLFNISTNKREIKVIAAVAAIGSVPKKLELRIPDKARDKLLYEIYPIRNVRKKKIVVIGAGDTAFNYALSLGEKNDVFILNRSDILKCLPALNDECDKNPNINYLINTNIENFNFEDNRLTMNCLCDGEKKTIQADYVIAAVGREINYDILQQNLLDKIEDLTASKRFFLAGDARNDKYRQLSLSVGDGVKTAMEIFDDMSF